MQVVSFFLLTSFMKGYWYGEEDFGGIGVHDHLFGMVERGESWPPTIGIFQGHEF